MVMMVTPVVVAMYDIPATSHPEQGGNLLAVHSGNLLLTPSNLLLWYCGTCSNLRAAKLPKSNSLPLHCTVCLLGVNFSQFPASFLR